MKKLTLLIGITCLPLSVSYGMLTCGICKKFSCRKKPTMITHLAYVHKLWSCPHCQKRIQGYQTYKEHVRDTHGRRTCSGCVTRTFESEAAYRLHVDAFHFPSETYKWLCGDCKTRFPTLERFVMHAILKHKQYACWYCMGETEKGTQSQMNAYGNKKDEFLKHMKDKHGKLICTECNMRVFDLKEGKAYEEHIKEDNHKRKNITKLCKFCNRTYTFRYKAEAELHKLQHASFLLFLERTIPGHTCCIPYRTFVLRARYKDYETEEAWYKAKIHSIREFYLHILAEHKCCLFCENPVTDTSREALKQTLESITYRQIARDARMFIRLDENTFTKGEVPVIPCDMCGSALYPNRKSRLFFASIKEFPFGKGLDRQDYPFHHLEYDECKAEKNTMMSVIKEVAANKEESCLIPKKEEKDGADDVILGEEDSEEEEEEEKEEENKKEDKKEEAKEKPKTDK